MNEFRADFIKPCVLPINSNKVINIFFSVKNGTLHAHKIDFNVNKCASYKNDKANKNQIRPRYCVVTSRKHCDIGRFIGDRERREAKKICQFCIACLQKENIPVTMFWIAFYTQNGCERISITRTKVLFHVKMRK